MDFRKYGLALVLAAGAVPAWASVDAALSTAAHSPARAAANVARDSVRHPVEELAFFGLRSDANVVEIWPGRGYWTEILAPYLAAHGSITVCLPGGADAEKQAQAFHSRFSGKPGFDAAKITFLGPQQSDVAPAGSADFVLTFRNVHNWMEDGYADQAFAAFFKALKPGGVLGVEEHRGLASVPQDPKAESGYVRQDYVIALAKKAGFVLDGSSEIDANPRDTKDYPKGVWTLPPSFELKGVDHAKYAAIGEADNMVLRFRKPAS